MATLPRQSRSEFDDACRARWPTIPWSQPIDVSVAGVERKIACRLCIARYGLKAMEIHRVPYAFDTLAQFATHVREVHPKERAQ